jgi:peptidoglycan/xylan/chitin deacetylase (PgdA/CDA1 family)
MIMQTQATVFLMYHELALPGRNLCQSEPGYTRYVVAMDEFKAQMSAIRSLGMTGVSVGEALQFSGPAVAITVDDGCETDLLAIAPVLKQFGFNATFYVTAGVLGKPGYVSTDQLRELSRMGFEIGSHSMTHPYLTDLDEAGLNREIADSKTALEKIIQQPVHHFSCPGGRYDARTISAAKNAGYRTMATSIPQANSPSTDPFSLGRIAITRGLSTSQFERMCRGESLWRNALKTGLRDGAKRLLGNSSYDRLRAALLKKE